VRRQLEYWKRYPITLLIVEEAQRSSTTEYFVGLARVIHAKSPRSFTERMDLSCSLIESEFVALCSDDDLYLPRGLIASINQLDLAPSAVGSIGRSMRFSKRRKSIFGELINEENQFANLSSQDAISRVLTNYAGSKISNPTFGVYRSQVWREVTSLTYTQRFSSAYAYEFVWSACMRYGGVIALHDDLSWMSSAENVSTIEENGFDRTVEIIERFTESRFTVEVAAMKKSVLNWMESKQLSSRNELETMFDLHIEALLRRYRYKRSIEYQSSSRQVLLRLLTALPNFVTPVLRRYSPTPLEQRLGFDIFYLNRNGKSLSRRSARFSHDEFRVFRDAVMQTQE